MRPGPPANVTPRAYGMGGVAPALVLDIEDAQGNTYFWADRPLNNIPAVITDGDESYLPWIVSVGTLHLYRSLQTDTLTLALQNLSGDVLQSDFEKIVRAETLDGALYVFRYYAADLAFAWIEMQGIIAIGNTPRATVTLNCTQLLQGQDDTPSQQVSENCQLVWGQPRCGATGDTECLYTYQSCQVVERFVGIQSAFEINNPAVAAVLPATTFNRARAW